ncbi:Anthranilate synthase, amidotransferase component @ Para-aminobenzoate synthase, amidotransferase component [hydrothermal vent metagenome]|uniref:Anthranilate synthase, amidotransferase component @ Para-aminobenzoate synthase, amidotransferase component n=1 Tax=hydrothermal vent metagenome TaxID=652676 RepID=A0A3B0R6K4_9ZZZZ
MLLMIDNYDSFTYNLVQYFQEMDEEVRVFRNDAITVDEIKDLSPDRLVISPGPCDPSKAGVSVEAIKTFAGKVPVLGVCLGHQSVAYGFGGRVIRAERLMHGKTSMVHHDGKTIYDGIDDPFEATRYHSLIVERESLPDCFEVSAWTGQEDGLYEIMGIRHKDIPLEGMQFHPESILTGVGKQILRNFLKLTT